MSRRAEQMGSTLDRALREVFARGFADPRMSGLLTITGVRVSEDLREATVSVSVFPEDRQELAMHGLKAAAGHIRHELDSLVETRQLPRLFFRLDKTLKTQAKVIDAIAKADADQLARQSGAPGQFGPPRPARSGEAGQ